MPSKPARLTLAQKDAIRDFARTLQTINMKDLGKWIHDNFSISVHRKTISTILNDTRCLDDACIDSDVATKRYNLKAPINVGLDRELLIWINKCDAMNVSITGDLIKEQALAIYETQPSPKKPMHFSSGWLYCFMKRHDLTSRRLHGERASLAKTKLMTEDIYNMDESALFYKRAPDTTISKTATQGLKNPPQVPLSTFHRVQQVVWENSIIWGDEDEATQTFEAEEDDDGFSASSSMKPSKLPNVEVQCILDFRACPKMINRENKYL
ncbi:hypothetical protein Ae201684P_022197 [Aphanomyces euteiches]|nr:hypothetical protein Ae201684P_022197 [Aphanomyces euteiches]